MEQKDFNSLSQVEKVEIRWLELIDMLFNKYGNKINLKGDFNTEVDNKYDLKKLD